MCKQLSVTDAAYLAGLIDGEGSIMAIGGRTKVAIRLSIANTKRVVLEWVRDAVGIGAIVTTKRRTPNSIDSGWWVINADGAESVLKQVRPYLVIKGEQADLAISIRERLRDVAQRLDHSWQDVAMARMKELNRRGPAPAMEATV